MRIEPSKEEMLKVIYEKIADKTLSFGCSLKADTLTIVASVDPVQVHLVLGEPIKRTQEVYDRIIGHPVMIGDVLDRYDHDGGYGQEDWLETIFLREDKRKPIDNQSDECILYVYNLVKGE